MYYVSLKVKHFRIPMKKVLLLACFSLLIACNKEGFSPYNYSNEGDIYSTSDKVKFREVLFTLKPYILVNAQKKYVVSDSIKNVVVKINDKTWSVVHSFPMVTTQFLPETVGNWRIMEQALSYPIVAPFQAPKTTLTTAKEYAILLSNFFIIENGTYFCRIESFDIRQQNGLFRTVKPQLVTIVEVKDNSRNAWLGELEVQVPN
jgi:hypothetical protein